MTLDLPCAALDVIDSRQPAMIETVVRWAEINSGSHERAGLARMAEEIEAALAVLPASAERLPLAPTERVRADGGLEPVTYADALRIQVRPDAPVQVALTGHYDTVFPASSAFQKVSRPEANVLNGPGVADMKGGILVMIEALAAFELTAGASNLGYTVLLSPDEETGSLGSAPLLAMLGAKAHVGMTYEPALPDGALAGARKGSGNYSLAIHGRSAHVGRAFAEGRNAMVAAARAALQLDALNGRRSGVTVNVGAIDGGGAVNVVPAHAVVRFNVRMDDEDQRAWLEREIDAICAAAGDVDGVRAHLHGGVTRPPKPMTPSQEKLFEWVRVAGEALGLPVTWNPTGGVCEGNNLLAAGCPNVDTLGVRGGAIHSDAEFALVDSFSERAKLSLLLLNAFATGAFDVRSLRS